MPGHAWKREDMFIVHGGGPRQERRPLPPQIRDYYSGLSIGCHEEAFPL
jgi:hypothetical protein